jgi:uncharacterized protein (TIGR02599 family)
MPINPRLAMPGSSIKKGRGGFTLVELLVSMTLLVMITGVVMQMTNQTSTIWRSSNAKIQAFQEGRAGFESMTRKLAQATLNTYYDYYNAAKKSRLDVSVTGTAALADFVPATYDRVSDLHFISGQATTLLNGSPTPIITQTHAVFFQAPLGYSTAYQQLDNALNACGYFLQFDDASEIVPGHVQTTPGYKPRYRFRLMEMTQPTEAFWVYNYGTGTAVQNTWFENSAATNSRVVAENVIALVLLPSLPARDDDPSGTGKGASLAPNYNYNSRVPYGTASDPAWSGATPPFPPDAFTSYPVVGSTSTGTRHHQLPPLIRVVMVVIDETSAARIQGAGTTVPKGIDLEKAGLFKDATQLATDLQAVEDICNTKTGNLTGNTVKLNYRIFTTDLIMREAKWSNN